MKKSEIQLLNCLKGFLRREPVQIDRLEAKDWQEFLQLSYAHKVIPMVYDTIGNSALPHNIPKQYIEVWRNRAFQDIMIQVRKSNFFLDFYNQLNQAGISCMVLKGIVCRQLYSKPDARPSGDEDLLLKREDFAIFEQICNRNHFVHMEGSDSVSEAAFYHADTQLKLEVHFELFSSQSDSYGDLNQPFMGVMERGTQVKIQGIPILTMKETEHLLYLILHSFKHFIHSGFGIRQVCDIVVFAETYGEKLDWCYLMKETCQFHADIFMMNLLDIGEQYLGFSSKKAGLPDSLKRAYQKDLDSKALLHDIFLAGIYGSSSRTRLHSSLITLNAVAAAKKTKKIRGAVLKTLFPKSKEIESSYPYLRKSRFLLPFAWVQRFYFYVRELMGRKKETKNSAVDSIHLGKRRVSLMKKYGIIR